MILKSTEFNESEALALGLSFHLYLHLYVKIYLLFHVSMYRSKPHYFYLSAPLLLLPTTSSSFYSSGYWIIFPLWAINALETTFIVFFSEADGNTSRVKTFSFLLARHTVLVGERANTPTVKQQSLDCQSCTVLVHDPSSKKKRRKKTI